MELLEVSLGTIFLSETVGSFLLLLLGGGVVANALLAKTKAVDIGDALKTAGGGGWLLINWGWGMAVFVGVLASAASGGHINPAVTVGVIASGAKEFGNTGIAISVGSTLVYFAGQLLGAMLGALVMWLTYKQHFDLEENQGFQLGSFSTIPQIRNYGWNLVAEIVGTFVLVFGIFAAGNYTDHGPTGPANLGWLGALGVALLVFAIGVSLGGPTGYAINPTRDLGPRIMHAILPIKGKGPSDWAYAWVPIVGPLIGGILAGLASMVLLPVP